MTNSVLGFLALCAVGVFVFRGYHDETDVADDVANDIISQYQLARKHGTPVDVCVRAGVIAEAYLQGKDENNYVKWQRIAKRDCEAAGM